MGWPFVAVLAVLLAGCAPPAPPRAESAPLAPAVSPRPTRTLARGYMLGLAVPDADSEPWRSLIHGARQEAAERLAELGLPEVRGRSGPERQAEQVRELVRRRVDLILVGGGEAPAVNSALDEAAGQKVPLGGLSSPAAADRFVFKVGPDRFAQGRAQAECLGSALGGRGAVGLLAGPPDNLAALERAQGFRETLQRQFPSTRIVAEHTAQLDRSAAETKAAEWLRSWPDLAGLAVGAEEPALGVLDALASAGRLGPTRVAVAQLGPLSEPSLRDGGIHCASAQQTVAEGRAAVRNALAYLAGQPYDKNVKSPPVLVTRENIDRVDWGALRAP